MTQPSYDVDWWRGGLASRRVALKLATLSAVSFAAAGCGDGRNRPDRDTPSSAVSPAAATTAAPDTDVTLVTRAIADEESLGGFCAAAAHRFPAQHALLAGLVMRQRQHVARLRGALSNLSPPVTHTWPPVPRRAKDLPVALGNLTLRARSSRSANCLAATSGLLAELFASMAAGHAVSVLLVEPRSSGITVNTPGSVRPADALQACLAAEQAAVFGYGVLGGVLSAAVSQDPEAEAAVSSYQAHRDRRDALTALISADGLQPVVAAAVYHLPFAVAGAPTARRLAQYLEARCATVYARTTSVTSGDARVLVSQTLLDCAVRGARWGSAPVALPGLEAA